MPPNVKKTPPKTTTQSRNNKAEKETKQSDADMGNSTTTRTETINKNDPRPGKRETGKKDPDNEEKDEANTSCPGIPPLEENDYPEEDAVIHTEKPVIKSIASEFDDFLATHYTEGRTKRDVAFDYLSRIDKYRAGTNLLMAEVIYLYFKDPEGDTKIKYSAVHGSWFAWQGHWIESDDLTADLFQAELLTWAHNLNRHCITNKLRATLSGTFVKMLEDRTRTKTLVNECKKFFTAREVVFDQNADLFAFANSVVLDLKRNRFRWSRPKDNCKRHSKINIPSSWLHETNYLKETKNARKLVWETLWAIFKRDGPFHPGDLV